MLRYRTAGHLSGRSLHRASKIFAMWEDAVGLGQGGADLSLLAWDPSGESSKQVWAAPSLPAGGRS
jgi:hypothetical protein